LYEIFPQTGSLAIFANIGLFTAKRVAIERDAKDESFGGVASGGCLAKIALTGSG